jgi:hypothetical protein
LNPAAFGIFATPDGRLAFFHHVLWTANGMCRIRWRNLPNDQKIVQHPSVHIYWRAMTAVRRIAELKRDDMPFIIRLEDGREFSVDSGGSVEIDVSANGGDRITVFDASENREYRIPVAAIARISIPEDLDDQRRWTKIG